MKKIILLGILVVINQFAFAQNKASSPQSQKIQGCIYADIVYKAGDKHRVQKSVMDAVTQKATLVDAEPETWQECVEDKNTDKTKSPRFYWRTLPH